MFGQKGNITVLVLIIVGVIALVAGAYYLGSRSTSSDNFSSPVPTATSRSETLSASPSGTPNSSVSTSLSFRKNRVTEASRKNLQNQCFAGIYEKTRTVCKVEAGYDPGPADGSGVKEWNNLTTEEKAKDSQFWSCYERVSVSEAKKCESNYQDVTDQKNAYYDCIAKGVDVGKYCADTTGYSQENNFPKDKESQYWQCMEKTRIEKESKCRTETGYDPR